jgi:hypothetical protein
VRNLIQLAPIGLLGAPGGPTASAGLAPWPPGPRRS